MPVRAQQIKSSELVDVLGEQVPTRLPNRFGFLVGWTSSGVEGNSNGAIWTDASCRMVTLEVWPDDVARESPMPEGQWVLVEHDTCTGNLPCLEYHAHSGSAVVDLSFVGLTQREASWVVAGVHI